MSLSVVLSDESANLVQAHVKQYGSVEAVIESAISRLHDEDQYHNDPKFIEYLRQALAECEGDSWSPLDLDALQHKWEAEWEAKTASTCRI